MDRKTWIVLLLCGIALAVNMHFRAKVAREQAEQAKKEAPAEVASPGPDGAPAATGALETVDPTVDPPVEETTVTLENGGVVFEFSSRTGGINFAELKAQGVVGAEDLNVRINRHGSHGVGALVRGMDRFIDGGYTLTRPSDREIVFLGRTTDGMLVKKRWVLMEDATGAEYRLNLELTVENDSGNPVELSDLGLFAGAAAGLYKREWENQTGLFYKGGKFKFKAVTWFKKGFLRSARSLFEEEVPALKYAGVSNQFFTTILVPDEPYDARVWGKTSTVELPERAGGGEKMAIRSALSLPAGTLASGAGARTMKFEVMMAPKRNVMLLRIGEGRGKVMNYGWFGLISLSLNWVLNVLHGWIFEPIASKWSWGLSIILLTILIRGVMWPLQNKSTRSMKRMSLLQPQIKELKEKYPDDPQKMNQEMMGLYREYGINPVGGCLPLLVQIPIFFGFYRMLMYAVELREQKFLWVDDLSQPDTVAVIPLFGGLPLNLLPIVMAGTMVLQMGMTPKTGDKMQQRIMMFMPIIFFVFCYNFASALALYWTTSNIFAIAQTLITKRLPDPELKKKGGGGKPGFFARLQERAEAAQKAQQAQRAKASGQAPPKPKKKRGPRTGG
ncbi:MAG: membrane protein insertase YidC [Akkermansiaceae bacterium]|nr:membrane protein insertase YidC [Akkermansiaceae bacterium]